MHFFIMQIFIRIRKHRLVTKNRISFNHNGGVISFNAAVVMFHSMIHVHHILFEINSEM